MDCDSDSTYCSILEADPLPESVVVPGPVSQFHVSKIKSPNSKRRKSVSMKTKCIYQENIQKVKTKRRGRPKKIVDQQKPAPKNIDTIFKEIKKCLGQSKEIISQQNICDGLNSEKSLLKIIYQKLNDISKKTSELSAKKIEENNKFIKENFDILQKEEKNRISELFDKLYSMTENFWKDEYLLDLKKTGAALNKVNYKFEHFKSKFNFLSAPDDFICFNTKTEFIKSLKNVKENHPHFTQENVRENKPESLKPTNGICDTLHDFFESSQGIENNAASENQEYLSCQEEDPTSPKCSKIITQMSDMFDISQKTIYFDVTQQNVNNQKTNIELSESQNNYKIHVNKMNNAYLQIMQELNKTKQNSCIKSFTDNSTNLNKDVIETIVDKNNSLKAIDLPAYNSNTDKSPQKSKLTKAFWSNPNAELPQNWLHDFEDS